MSSFSIIRKKTPFQKHREEEGAKKKRAEDETARLYAEFLESFQGDNTPGSKSFVRGGTMNPSERVKTDSEGEKSKDGISVPKKGSRYVPSFIPPSFSTKGKDSEKKKEEEKVKDKAKGKTRNIDHFMEELKHEQEMRERRNQEREHLRENHQNDNSAPSSRFDELPDDSDPSGRFPGSFDEGDPQTTNLYVGNLSPQVDENFLLRTFGRFGPIASVKIMWPRTEEERRRQRNCGFVAFMNRPDAQAAKDEMQGVIVYEYELKMGWGKSVALPSQALPAPPPGQMAIRSKEGATVVLSGPSGPPVTSVPNQNAELVLTPNIPDITVIPSEDDHLRHVIDTMALYVLDGGCALEQAIMERGRGKPLFSFLFDLGSKEHTYYIWRLYSFAQGDTRQRWRTEPFIMMNGSGRWIPPPLPASRSPEHEKESGTTYAAGRSRCVEPERTLTDSQRDEFEDMLRSLTLERSLIKEAMGFALDNTDAAGEIVEVLTESLTLKETPIPTKVARLMLVSDVLHNSSAPVKNASAYRTRFEASLPDIMESFNDLYRSITGRITAEAFKERVLKVVQVWADWFLFSDAYVNGLRATFLRSGVTHFHSLNCGGAAPEIENNSSSSEDAAGNSGLAMGGSSRGAAATKEELMRSFPLAELERRCRHNGLSLVGGREMMVARLLSLEVEEESEEKSRRGGYYDEELKFRHQREMDVEPETRLVVSPRNHRFGEDENEMMQPPQHQHGAVNLPASIPIQHVLPSSKWAREHDESDDEQQKGGSRALVVLSYSSSGSENAASDSSMPSHHDTTGTTEEQRQKLRRLEVALIEYRESLQEWGIKNPQEIEKKVGIHRKQLKSKFGLLNTSGKSSSETERRRDSSRGNSSDSSRKRNRCRSNTASPPPPRRLLSKRDRERDREKSGSREKGDKEERDRSRDRDRDRDRRRRQT